MDFNETGVKIFLESVNIRLNSSYVDQTAFNSIHHRATLLFIGIDLPPCSSALRFAEHWIAGVINQVVFPHARVQRNWDNDIGLYKWPPEQFTDRLRRDVKMNLDMFLHWTVYLRHDKIPFRSPT